MQHLKQNTNQRVNIFTWNIHGAYLYYLSHADAEFFIPKNADRRDGYAGKSNGEDWGENVHEISIDDIPYLDLDIILFQSKKQYVYDQYELFSKTQRKLPKVYIEHDPPQEHPTNTKHIVQDTGTRLVHVTHFNRLMWDSGKVRTSVIEHGVTIPESVSYSGKKDKGIVVINNLLMRGRRLGLDIFKEVRKKVPLDLVGINADKAGGLGELPHDRLLTFTSEYRFFFHPVRYTSLGLAVCEAMMMGQPVVGIGTTELATVIQNGETGFIDTDIDALISRMKLLLEDPDTAKEIGKNAQHSAENRFSIKKFTRAWNQLFTEVMHTGNTGRATQDNGQNYFIGGSMV